MSHPETRPRGREAPGPRSIPWEGWKDIGSRVLSEFSEDRVLLIAAGATFFILLSLFPALTAFVSIYGFVSDPQSIADHIALLGGLLPQAGLDIIKEQLLTLVRQEQATLSIGFASGLVVALWSANNGIKTLFMAMNIAYGEHEDRNFFRLNAVSLLFTLAAVGVGILFIISVGVVPAVLELAGLEDHTGWLISVLRWPVLFAVSWGAIAVIYRYGPSRERARWCWVAVGSFLSAAVWIVASILFSWYLQNFANYDKTYGSLGAIIGLMMWTWISAIIFIMGAELNAEIEHQTLRDSTIGPDMPMGRRGAMMADTVGKARHEDEDQDEAAAAPRTARETTAQEGSRRAVRPSLLLLMGLASLVLDKARERRSRGAE